MHPKLLLFAALSLTPVVAMTALGGCEEKQPAATPSESANADDHGHEHGPDGEHIDQHEDHSGPVLELGEQAIGSFSAKATRDEGEITAGQDTPIDVTLTPAEGSTAVAAAVRFWVGTEDASGSVKARAEVENPADPNRWHVHVEIPNPLPAGSKLWVEIEDASGATSVGSFELKA